MEKVRIIPIKKPVGGVAPGKVALVSPREAEVLVKLGRAKYATTKQRTYRRRDMKAEE